MNWVTIKRFCEISGYSDRAVQNKIARGDWILDQHWRKAPDGRIFINLTAVENWLLSNR